MMKLLISRGCIVLLAVISSYTVHAQWMQWECRSNNTLDEFGTYINEMKDRGYAPVNISAVTHFNSPRISSIWRKANINDWACWYGMNQQSFIDKITDFNNRQLSPIDITVWNEDGEARFAAIWQKLEYEGVIEIGIGADELKTKIVDWDKKGYSPRDLNGYSLNGVTYYTCIFDRKPKGILSISYGLTEAAFQEQFDRLTPLGYYPIDVNYFNDNGTIKCNGIWAKGNDAWECRRGYSIEEFQDFLDRKTNEGFTPVDVDQYYANGNFFFGATLTKPTQQAIANPGYNKPTELPINNTGTVLPIAPVEQQTQVWCWLATGEMIFKHFGVPNLNPNGNYQCGIIGSIFRNSICNANCFNANCIRGSGSNANTVRMFKDYAWIADRSVFSCNEGYELNFNTIRSNIDRDKPILCGISPNRKQYYFGAEHVAVLIGYEVRNGIPYVIINDPYPYPSNGNLYIRSGAVVLQRNQYLISLESFTQNMFWHWSLSNIQIN